MTIPKLWPPPSLELFPVETSFERRRLAFYEFHAHNPHIYELILTKCNQAKNAGHDTYSIEAIINVIRWNFDINVNKGKSDFKFSNDHKSFYAAFLIDRNPHLKGFFNMNKNPELDKLRRKTP